MSTGSWGDHETSRRRRQDRRKTESRSRANPCMAQKEIDRGRRTADGGEMRARARMRPRARRRSRLKVPTSMFRT